MVSFCKNSHPELMEMAISAAEGYSAILAKDNSDLPDHPDKREVDNDISLSALVAAAAADSKQPKAKVGGHKPVPRKEKRGKGPSRDSWDNQNHMREMMVNVCEEVCSKKFGGGVAI